MFFNFVLWNHNDKGQKTLEDVIGIVGHQLRALGHDAQWLVGGKAFIGRADGINVVVEGFTPIVREDMVRAKAAGAGFLCLATEEPTPTGFNGGKESEMVRRQAWFEEIPVGLFDGILHLVDGAYVNTFYSRFAPSAPIELGFARSLLRPAWVAEPAYDVGFFGTMSNRRFSILKRLANRLGTKSKGIRIVGDFAPQAERDRAMQDAKIVVQLRKYENMTSFSNSRATTALCAGRCLIAESGHAPTEEWRSIVSFARSESEFFATVLATRAVWRATAAAQLDKFMTKMSPERCIGEPLRRIGFFERFAAAA